MREQKLFYSPLWREDLTADCDAWVEHRAAMLDRVYALERGSKGVLKSNFGGWQSDSNIYRHAEFQWLLNHIMRLSKTIAPELSPELELNGGTMWANINRRGNFNSVHTHPDSMLSGVCYIKVSSEDQGQIEFFDSREGSPTTHWASFMSLRGETPLSEGVHSVTPHEGMILFFPSWLRHWVTPNLTDEARVSVSFNVYHS